MDQQTRDSWESNAVERVSINVFDSSTAACQAVAAEIAALVRRRQKEGRCAVLGLATGSTPVGVYEELVRLHRDDGLSFRNVRTFNLDEYWPMGRAELQSYHRFMHEHLFDLVDIEPSHVHIPDGEIPQGKVEEACREYEALIQEAGGIDFQVLGIGRSGHIGFNEPGSSRESRTRLITLDQVTRMDAAADFFGEWHVPRRAVTMGVGTILDARRVALLAFGEHKARVIRSAVEGDVTASVAASFLQEHPSATFFLDAASAAELTRFKSPWLLGPLALTGQVWDARMVRKAVIWLSQMVRKPITKLTDSDYNEHGLSELLSARGGTGRGGAAYDINIEVFKTMQRTITGWPGGKRDVPAATGASDAFPKRIIVFSPHPDDDVISMGGTFIRLCEQGHDVHVAYQTSGNIAVWDETALRHADFIAEYCRAFGTPAEAARAEELESTLSSFIAKKKAGAVDPPQLQTIKGLIRRTEARAGARYSGVAAANVHFLDLPFYETGRVRKKPLGPEDIRIVADLLKAVRPHQIYAAGDLSDPHGTHRVCLSAIMQAIRCCAREPWRAMCEIWLYRGAWQEWGVDEIDMGVPLSPDEVVRKRMAIFKHESQKDRALFPGPSDAREFWQRAEDRNRATAAAYDALGLAEYEAIEGFVRANCTDIDAEPRRDEAISVQVKPRRATVRNSTHPPSHVVTA